MAENFQNFYVTKLREACDASATTIYVDNPPNFSEGTLVLEFSNSTKHEIIHFTGKSGYGLTGCTRGHEGTTAQSHSAGVDVRQNVTAGILDKIINRAITTENIADNAVTTAKINNGAVTADKIDFTTFRQPFSKSISQNNKKTYTETIDCSAIPSGAKFLVIANGYANIDGGSNHGYYFYIEYNSVDVSGTVWGNALTNANTAVPSGAIALITKASGVDSVNIKFTSSNCTLREIRFNVCVVPFSG